MKQVFWTVYSGGRQAHLTDNDVMREVSAFEANNRKIISDAAAQTIAAWWHSPTQPLTTGLSTKGDVDRHLTLDMFFDESTDATTTGPTWVGSAPQRCLSALGEYLTYHQTNAPSAVRPCACHTCFDTVVGIAGELCSECEDAGCDAQFAYECDRPTADESDECPAGCTCDHCVPQGDCPEFCTCIMCIPGA